MGLFDGCLLASDIDGTLLESGYINPVNVKLIDYFMSEGGKFSIATGRSVGAISDVIKQLNEFSPSVVANGCMIYDYGNSKILHQEILSATDHYFADFIINQGIKVGAEIHCGPNSYTLKRTENTTLHQVYEKFEAPEMEFSELNKLDWNKAIFVFESSDDREKMYEILADKKAECNFIKTSAVIGGVFQYYLEMVPKGVSKASALKKLCEIINIRKGGLFAIGDYYNDIEMLENADISAVVMDSPEDLKSLADYVACSCKDGAVADFIDYLKEKFKK